jgi:hypothetical protein
VASIAMGAGAVLTGTNISSAATTGWLLRAHGTGTRRLLERCGALLCLLTAFGFFVNGVAGALLLAGPASRADGEAPVMSGVARELSPASGDVGTGKPIVLLILIRSRIASLQQLRLRSLCDDLGRDAREL